MDIKYFTSPNDMNHRNEHALINNHIEFFKFPYQSYNARYNNTAGTVSHNMGIWYVSIWKCLPTGKEEPLNHSHFENKDDAFLWAYSQLIKEY